MTSTKTLTATYWTADDIAAMSDEQLDNFIAICRNGEHVAFATRNGRLMRRVTFLLERLAYPEQDRRRAAA
jgi:hypothetical protein